MTHQRQDWIRQDNAEKIQKAVEQSIVNDTISDEIKKVYQERQAEEQAFLRQTEERKERSRMATEQGLRQQEAENEKNTASAEERLMQRQLLAAMTAPLEEKIEPKNSGGQGSVLLTSSHTNGVSVAAGGSRGGQGESTMESIPGRTNAGEVSATDSGPGTGSGYPSHTLPWLIAGAATLFAAGRGSKKGTAGGAQSNSKSDIIALPRTLTKFNNKEVKS